MTRKSSMAPVGAADPILLVLGSLPGEVSLAAQRYYAHPQNQFWRLLGGAIGEELAPLDYDRRVERLAELGIALWDVVGEGSRVGSLDGAIRNAVANPLAKFVADCPRLAAVAFNGQTAARLGRRALSGSLERLAMFDLPSSSPAYTVPFADKAARWSAVGAIVSGPKAATLKP